MFVSARGRALAWAVSIVVLCSCAAEVHLEDGGGDADASGDDADGAGTGAGAPAGTGGGPEATSGAGAGDTGDVEALAAACDSICKTRCIPTSATCERDCAAVVDDCIPEMLAVLACVAPAATGPCPEEADPAVCETQRQELRRCQDVYVCGHGGHAEETVCTDESDESCDCTEGCDDGHTGRSRCRIEERDQVCECWFDDVPVGECRMPSSRTHCRVPDGSCCRQLFR